MEAAGRAIALAGELGDEETLAHAETNLGTALMMSEAFDEGQELLERSLERAMAAGLDEHACRALTNLAWSFNDVVWLDLARDTAERALALASERDQWGFATYISAVLGLINLSSGDWDAAAAHAAEAWASGGRTTHRVPSLQVSALVDLRRGGEDPAPRLAEAWEIARSTQELQRLRPIAAARAEHAWLAGDAAQVDAVTAATFELALERGGGRDIGELAVWRARAGLLAEPPEPCLTPYALEIAGDHRGAAAEWAALGAPYERALALIGADDPEALLEALEVLDALGAAPVAARVRTRLRQLGAPRIPARPAGVHPCPPGGPVGAGARGARPRRRGHVEPGDRGEAGAVGAHRGAPRRLGPSQARGRVAPGGGARRPRWGRRAREVGVPRPKIGGPPRCAGHPPLVAWVAQRGMGERDAPHAEAGPGRDDHRRPPPRG